MPGILKMSSSVNGGFGARDVDSMKRTHDGKMVNGERNIVRKDSPASAPAVQTPSNGGGANGTSALATTAPAQEPPELPHIKVEKFHALSTLTQRISQETYNELTELLTQMREMKPSQANGTHQNALGLPNPQDAEINKQKKLMVMRFAMENRSKFIKLLVLTEWGKKASADLSKLIDLYSWQMVQARVQDWTDRQIEEMKVSMSLARQSNPDIRTALEILGTGKAEWIPHMGFIPAPPMTAEKTLKLLRYMNTSLSTRMIVHEKVPRQFSKWRVENGRVTFVVQGEFECELMSSVEDSSDPFYFVDLRLLFSPAPVIATNSRFFNRLQDGVNNLLRQEGLEACFGYLHNVVLSHKIFILSVQANELLRAGWAGSLRSEYAHRVLWIQYWVNKPGKKNWIEIGVSSNKPKDGKVSWRGPPIPSISVRWFREGVHVKDANLEFDWTHLSAERMLKQVIAMHTEHLLRATHQTFSSSTITRTTFSDTEPSDCRLDVSIGSKDNTTTLSIEPITGRYTLRPANVFSSPAEIAINRSPEPQITSNTITQVLARSVLESIQRYSQQLGWRSVGRQALRMELVKIAVNLDVLRFSLFWPRGWSKNIALSVVVDTAGESWWIFELGANGSSIDHAQKISMEGRSSIIDRPTLSRIERVAVHLLAFSITWRALGKESKTCSINYEFAQPRRPDSLESVVRGWALHVKTSELLISEPGDKPWLEPAMQITGQGFRSDHRNIWHIATGTMVPEAATDMQKLMSASPQSNFKFKEGGKFSILLSTPFGHDAISELKERLRDLNRLRSFATTLEKRKMRLKSSSLEQVEFSYGETLSAKVIFDKRTDIKIDFEDKNPHNRIHSFLTDIVNDRSIGFQHFRPCDNNGLDRFCNTLLLTRPLVTVLNALEKQRPSNFDNPMIHVHDLQKYRITYSNPPCSFDIRLKRKDDKMLWLIEDNIGIPVDYRPKTERSPNFKHPDNLKQALHKLFREWHERWYGVRTGIIAELDGIPDALKKLNDTVLSCYVEGGVPQESVHSEPPRAIPPNRQNQNTSGAPNRPGANAPNARPPPAARAGGVKREIITID